ncbi:MAG: cupin domain-containing protein [Bacillota bacterium]|uniref:Cupin domain-containing protein n=1 Tax=Virgibacillus salarius TaxID=447199 RepID=A0A941IAF1_9BACI|nr:MULTISPECIES: cupin domain-containing protein [Bacillaceae]NAZ10564.1 cupin domain-containing protein [Agaribacter marinus]MBR7797854.1 cupin domain-containing protein [Virgibacillus salarius]MCC2251965.1 cupin domain-containing protein [Virgibacillus sp. AGTR]MDY7046194.1 cupin domain-containing protein [Virgibacillus sp. M23]QRZ19232.1 cupin domain-containing protein [Virgibacillus sp. AGTR]
MVTSYMDYTKPDVEYFSDLNTNRLFTRNSENYINRLGRDVLNTLSNVSILDIYLSKGHVVEPHYHQNAAELVYCISGSAVVSFMNPFNNEVKNIPITPGQVANIPQGWWHWEEASENNTHLLAIFDAPYPEYILGSDILTKTPVDVIAHTYCLDPEAWKEAVAPIKNETIIIGPTDECSRKSKNNNQGYTSVHYPNMPLPHPYNPMQYVYSHPHPGYYPGYNC